MVFNNYRQHRYNVRSNVEREFCKTIDRQGMALFILVLRFIITEVCINLSCSNHRRLDIF